MASSCSPISPSRRQILVGESDKSGVPDLNASDQVANQISSDDLVVSITGGARGWTLDGWVSLGLVLTSTTSKKTFEIARRKTDERMTISGDGFVTPAPAAYLGLAFDMLSITAQRFKLNNLGDPRAFEDGAIIGRNDTVVQGWLVTVGIDPIAAFQALVRGTQLPRATLPASSPTPPAAAPVIKPVAPTPSPAVTGKPTLPPQDAPTKSDASAPNPAPPQDQVGTP